MNIVIIQYNAGNVSSVQNALLRLGIEAVTSNDHGVIRSADKIIFPGVGEASSAMKFLREHKLPEVITALTQPILGICLGMQLMCTHSEEGNTDALGIFPTVVRKISVQDNPELKSPHIGWNTIHGLKGNLYKGVPENAHVYYVHGYCADICEETTAITQYGQRFSASLQLRNFYGVQYHPEKSGAAGEFIIRNFLDL